MKREWFIIRLGRMYVDAFRHSSLTRGMMLLIAVKLIILFAVIKVLFFPNLLGRIESDEERVRTVVESLTLNPATTESGIEAGADAETKAGAETGARRISNIYEVDCNQP